MNNKSQYGLLIPVLILGLLSSCRGPSDDFPETNVFEVILYKLKPGMKTEEKSVKKSETKIDMRNILIVFYKDSSILVDGQKARPGTNDILYSFGNNQFKLHKPIYITFINNRISFSFDKKVWHYTKNDGKRNIHNLKNNYFVSTEINDNKIQIRYKLAYSLGGNPEMLKLEKEREVVKLKKGMIFRNEKDKNVNFNLNEKILFIPENTILLGRINIGGNVINSELKDGRLIISSLKNLYIYVRNKMITMSFDRKNWDVSVFSFIIKSDYNVRAIEDDRIYFDISGKVEYNKDTASFSIIKFLL